MEDVIYFDRFATANNIEVLETLMYKIDDLKNIFNEYIKNKNLKIKNGVMI